MLRGRGSLRGPLALTPLRRPPVASLTRGFTRVVVTDAMRRCLTSDDLTVTLIVTSDPASSVEPGESLVGIEGTQLTAFE